MRADLERKQKTDIAVIAGFCAEYCVLATYLAMLWKKAFSRSS